MTAKNSSKPWVITINDKRYEVMQMPNADGDGTTIRLVPHVDKNADTLRRVKAFIELYIYENVTAPSLREIQSGCGISSTSETRRFWRMLIDAGEIVRTRGHARAFTTRWAREAIQQAYAIQKKRGRR